MNILVFSWRDLSHPKAGGAEQVVDQYAKGWVKAGHQVTIFSSMFEGAKRYEENNGTNIIRFGGEAITVKIWAFIWFKFFNHQKFDLVIDHFHGLPFFTPLYVSCKKVGFIHELAGNVWSMNPYPFPLNKITAFLGFYFEPFIFKIFYRHILFLVVSKSTRDELILLGINKQKIKTIYSGYKRLRLNKNCKKERLFTLLYLGSLSIDKGMMNALLVLKALKDLKFPCQCWVVGKEGSLKIDYLKQQVISLGLKKNVKFWGYVAEDLKGELIQKSHLLLHPSFREGWGLTVLEAGSLGIPTVGFNVVGLRDSIQDNITGILTKKNTPTEMAKEVISILNNQKKYNLMSRSVKKWSKNFSWEKAIFESLNYIKTL